MQSKRGSFFEAVCNTACGFFISFLVWAYAAAPIFGLPYNANQNFKITGLFTVVSIIRSYLWRRIFNRRDTK